MFDALYKRACLTACLNWIQPGSLECLLSRVEAFCATNSFSHSSATGSVRLKIISSNSILFTDSELSTIAVSSEPKIEKNHFGKAVDRSRSRASKARCERVRDADPTGPTNVTRFWLGNSCTSVSDDDPITDVRNE